MFGYRATYQGITKCFTVAEPPRAFGKPNEPPEKILERAVGVATYEFGTTWPREKRQAFEAGVKIEIIPPHGAEMKAYKAKDRAEREAKQREEKQRRTDLNSIARSDLLAALDAAGVKLESTRLASRLTFVSKHGVRVVITVAGEEA